MKIWGKKKYKPTLGSVHKSSQNKLCNILDGIRFALDGVDSEPLDLQNCWEPYEPDERLDGHGHPVIYENKGMIHLR